MASCHKVTKREPVLWQTLSLSALAAPVGSLRIACVLTLQELLVIGARGTSNCPDPKVGRLACDTGTDQRNLPSTCSTLLGGFIRDLHIWLASLSLPHAQFLTVSIADR